MPINKIYSSTGETAIGTFAYSEISSGRFILKLYMCDFSGDELQLTEGVTYGNNGAILHIPTEKFNAHYDLDIDRPITINGLGSVTFASAALGFGVGGASDAVDWTAAIKRVQNDGTELTLVSGAAYFPYSVADAAFAYYRNSISLDVPLTTIKRGEKIRLTLSSDAIATKTKVFLASDPKNSSVPILSGAYVSDWSNVGTEGFALLPVRVEL